MRKIHDSPTRRARGRSRPEEADSDDAPALTPAQSRELQRRIRDLDDRNRYLLVCVFGPGFALYYNVSEDTYGVNDPTHATPFKRRAAAIAVRQLLGPSVRIVRCRVNRGGKVVLSSLPARLRRRPRRRPTRSS